jgi:hypothetical protein
MLAGVGLLAGALDGAAVAGDQVTLSRPAQGQPPDLPAHLVTQLINQQLEIDRRVTSVWSIAGHGNAAQTLADIQAHWGRAAGDAVWQGQHAGWLMIARRAGDRFDSVQIREQGDQITGYVTRWRDVAGGARAVQAGRSWLPPSVEAVTEVVSGDAGSRVTTWVGSSNHRPDRLLEQFGDIARAQGLRPAAQAPGRSALPRSAASDARAAAKAPLGPQIERYVGPSLEFVVTLEATTGKTAVVAHRMEFNR